MAAFTSKASGNWSTSGQVVWNEVGVPGNGDTVSLSHNITVDTNTTVGTSPSDTTTLVITGGGNIRLTIADGVTLVVRGNSRFQGNSGGVTLGAGSVWEFDSSAAGTPTTRYTLTMGNAFVDISTLIVNGTTGAHAVIRSNASGGNGNILPGNGSISVTATYVDFLRLGASATPSLSVNETYDISHFTFTSCGRFDGTAAVTAFNLSDGSFASPLDTAQSVIFRASASAGTKTVTRVAFSDGPWIPANGTVYTDCYFPSGYTNVAHTVPGTMTGGLVRYTDNSGSQAPWSMTDVYTVADQTSGNQHFYVSQYGDQDFDGLVFDAPHPFALDMADCIFGDMRTSSSVKRCLVLPSYSDGGASGCLLNPGSGYVADWAVVCEHNTVAGENAQLLFVENNRSVTVVTHMRSNLVASPDSGSPCYLLLDLTAASVDQRDLANPANITNNYIENPDATFSDPLTSTIRPGFQARFNTNPAGPLTTATGSGYSAGPAFVDATRNLATWAVYKAAASSGDTLRQKLDAAIALIAATPSLARSDLLPWVRAGFAPTNSALQNAGHDGVTIGAVEYVAVGGVAGLPLLNGGLVNGGLVNKGLIA